MGLYREVLYSNSPLLKQHNEFWGEMKKYNHLNKPSSQLIAEVQKRKIMEFQINAFKNDVKTKKVNSFLRLNGTLVSSSNSQDKIIVEKMQKVLKNIDDLVKSGAINKKTKQNLQANQALDKDLENKLKILGQSLKELRQSSNMVISSSYIDFLDNMMKSFSASDILQVLNNLFHVKGDILEQVGTEWFNQRIPSDLKVQAYSTGAIRGTNGQLIQDLIVVDLENTKGLDGLIDYHIGKNSNKQVTLKEFLNIVQNYKGQEQIVIDNNGEELLQQISLLSVQAKSGINQLPWNSSSKNTHVSIKGESGEMSKYCDFLQHIEQLRNTINNKWNGKKHIKKESDVYYAMANYELAKSLSTVLHLTQSANQYVLTPNGFMPFVTRILELYEKKGGNQYYFSFKGKIQLTDANDIITRKRPVIFKA